MTGIRKQHGRDKRANPPATWLATALKAAERRLLILTHPQMRGPGPQKGWYLDRAGYSLKFRWGGFSNREAVRWGKGGAGRAKHAE